MRRALVLGIGLLAGAAAGAEPGKAAKPAGRFGIEADLNAYPQATPKDALASVLKAIDNKRIDYLLAQLADPDFVARRVESHGGKFDELVKETAAKLAADPAAVKQLHRFLKDGAWDTHDTTASVCLKDVDDRRVSFRKVGGRWVLENAWKKLDAPSREE